MKGYRLVNDSRMARFEAREAWRVANRLFMALIWAGFLVFALLAVVSCLAGRYVDFGMCVVFEIFGLVSSMVSMFLLFCGIRFCSAVLEIKYDEKGKFLKHEDKHDR